MADIELIVKIPDEEYKKISNSNPSYADDFNLYYAIKNGTPIPDNATNMCGDSRFEIIAKAKEDITSATNIEDAKDEMNCLDSFLFRCWQMGWLDKYAPYQKGGKE